MPLGKPWNWSYSGIQFWIWQAEPVPDETSSQPVAPSPPVSPVTLVTPTPLTLRGRSFSAAHPAVMGIVNCTPDSFYAAARYDDLARAASGLQVHELEHLVRPVGEGRAIDVLLHAQPWGAAAHRDLKSGTFT